MYQKEHVKLIENNKNKNKFNFLKQLPCYLVESDADDLDIIQRFFEKSSKMLPQRNGSALTIGELMNCCTIIEQKQKKPINMKVCLYN